MTTPSTGSVQRLLWLGYLVAGILTIAAYFGLIAAGAPAMAKVTLYCVITGSAAIAVLYGCRRYRPAAWLPWLLLGLSQVVYAIADTTFYVSHVVIDATSFPGIADIFYLAHYPLVVAGLLALIRVRTPGRDLPGLLDAALLAVVAAMLSWLYLIAPQAEAHPDPLVKIASVAYPVMDLAMFAVALRLILGSGRRPLPFFLLCINLLAFLAADTIYVLQQLNGSYVAGNFLDAIWLSGNLALGAAALHPSMGTIGQPTREPEAAPGPLRIVALCAAALVAPATLLVQYARGSYSDIPITAIACGLLFVLTIARMAGLVAEQRRLAITDALTGLRTRRFFESRLGLKITEVGMERDRLAVLIVDVDHFKSVNDRYGHPAGDRVLIEIAHRLREATRTGDLLARYGGEEFAVVVSGSGAAEPARIGERLRLRVAESPITLPDGELVTVTVSVGTASFPDHGRTPTDLITAADRALYSAKALGRDRIALGSAVAPRAHPPGTGSVLVDLERLASEVDGWLSEHEHSEAVGYWAGMVAAQLGHCPNSVRRAELAGRLHDIGKALIPESIWTKQAKLSDEEWQLVRQHPVYGWRLAKTVPGLTTVAEIVRQHHERFDGNGYPDGLAGSGIRIEARILAVCDSWAAMLANRTYKAGLSEQEASEELLRGRGSQFDPQVVDVFLALWRDGRIGPLALLGSNHYSLISASVFQNINS